MKYNFDKIINRENTDSVKYDLRKEIFGTENVIPMWVADMDFETPEFIREDIIKKAKESVYGYTIRGKGFNSSILSWMKKRHDWEVEKEWISFAPGIVPAINIALLAFSKPGDKILIQPPVYHPFFYAIKDHDRIILENNLENNNSNYVINFEDFEEKAKEARIFILCNPHNPVGRMWTKEELSKIISICKKHHVLIFSDEIHSDLILSNSRHTPILTLAESQTNCISFYAPSKSFNLAGLATSFLIIKDEELRKNYEKTLNALHVGMGNIFGFTALESAYSKGEEWLENLLVYLRNNLEFLEKFIKKNIPEIIVTKPEATYLVWLDFRHFKLNDEQLKEFMISKACLGLNDGITFGEAGSGFQRINIALPQKKLEQALLKLKEAISLIREK